MAFIDVLVRVAGVVFLASLVSLLLIADSKRLRAGPGNAHRNVASTVLPAVVLGVVLGANSVIRDTGLDLSWVIGVNITGVIHAFEGNVVPMIQSVAFPALTTFFSFAYVYGYTFLLVFPFVLYLIHEDSTHLERLVVAYIVNYGVGLVCYVLFVAYGPRNVIPELVDNLLYVHWPQSQLLTGKVNANTNVFPSLHTSLSVTVALLAYRTRDQYPRWVPIAGFLAVTIALSTMYLGIHWATDVGAGILLAALSLSVADSVADNDPGVRSHGLGSSTRSGRGLETITRLLRRD